MKHLIILITVMALNLVNIDDALAEKVVVIPLFSSSPSGVAAIPVYCDEAILGPAAPQLDNITCRRADTREEVTPVPSSHFLFITDVVINRNSLGVTGRGFISIGLNTGGPFVQEPRFDFTVINGQLNHLAFSTPYLVFHEGERIGAYNGNSAAFGGATNDIFISGYLVEADKFGR